MFNCILVEAICNCFRTIYQHSFNLLLTLCYQHRSLFIIGAQYTILESFVKENIFKNRKAKKT